MLDVKELTIGFVQRHRHLMAVQDVHFSIAPGETLALLGESGCGKSLTSLALMRLLPLRSAYGKKSEIRLDEEDLLTLPEQTMRHLRGRKLAMIFQEPMTALNPVFTIGEQLAEVLSSNFRQAAKQKRMLKLLQEVELADPAVKLSQYPHQLSGGQKQRVMIAMALARQPDLLIADEPTTALDVTTQAQILSLLKKLQAQYQMSILLITHDMGVVKAVADRVCVMYAGQIVESATVDTFLDKPLHPYSQQLLLARPSFTKRKERLPAISGHVPVLDAMPSGCRFHTRCAHVFAPCPHIEPQVQRINERLVRCHLYPEHSEPPAIKNKEEFRFVVKDHNPLRRLDLSTAFMAAADKPRDVEAGVSVQQSDDKVILSVQALSVYFYLTRSLWHRFTTPSAASVFKAVDDVSFDVRKGKTLAIVGESGSGKTTMSRALIKLIPITSGDVFLQEKNISTLAGQALKEFRKKIQIIFQDPFSSMNPRMTVADILAEGMQAQGMSGSFIHKRRLQLLDQVNLPQQSLTRYPHQFSGGQRQRICIARALATEPQLLICDEPTSALDMSVQAQILNLLKELQYELHMSYLFISHNLAVVGYMSDDVLVMKQGKMVEMGTCEAILTNPQHEYTKQLLVACEGGI